MEEKEINNREMLPEPEPEESKGLSIKDILHVLRKHWIPMLGIAAVCTAAGLGGAIVKDKKSPSFTANASIMISVEQSNLSTTTAYQLSSYISNTAVAFIKEDAVLDRTVKNVKEQYPEYNVSTAALRGAVGADLKGESLIVNVSYTSSIRQQAIDVTQVLIYTVQEVADEVRIDSEGKPVLDPKTKAPVPVYPFLYRCMSPLPSENPANHVSSASSKTKFTLIGLAIGVVAAILYAVLREMFDNSFKDNRDIERELGLPVLSNIPEWHFKDENKKGGK